MVRFTAPNNYNGSSNTFVRLTGPFRYNYEFNTFIESLSGDARNAGESWCFAAGRWAWHATIRGENAPQHMVDDALF